MKLTCLKTDTPGATALAALATVGLHHGLPSDVASLRRLTGLAASTIDGVMLIYAAGLCGFDALPFEVSFDQLTLVTLPAILLFRDSTFRVLYSVDDTHVTLGNPLTGETHDLSSLDLQAAWTGDVYQLQPNDALAAARQALYHLHSPTRRAAERLGFAPLSLPRILLTFAAIAWTAGLFFLPFLALLTGACGLISLWMLAFPHGCARCGATKSLSGSLPLPALGAAFYAFLTADILFAQPPIVAAGLLAATGAHLALVGLLIRKRIACYACLATALLAWTATVIALCTRIPFTRGLAGEALLAPTAAAAAWLALHLATRLAGSQAAVAAISLASRVTSETPPAPGAVRLVVYSRRHCPICAYAKGIILPSLAEEFGGALIIETRDAGRLKLAVPLFFVTGANARLALASIATDEMLPRLATAIQHALTPAQGPLAELSGLLLSGFENSFSSSQK